MDLYKRLLTLFLCLGLTTSVYAQEDSDTIDWISKFYGIGWPSTSNPCIDIVSNSSYSFQCINNHIISINFQINTYVDHGPPNSTLEFLNLPSIKSFTILQLAPLNYSYNILDKLVNLPYLGTIDLTRHSFISHVPDQLYQGRLLNLYLINCQDLHYFDFKKAQYLLILNLFNTPIESSDFGNLVYDIKSLTFGINNNVSLAIQESQFPKLTSLQYDNVFENSKNDVTINSTIITYLDILYHDYLILNLNTSNLVSLNLRVSVNSTTNLVYPIQQSAPLLKAITILNYVQDNFPSLQGSNNLEIVDIERSNLTVIPYIPPTVKSLTILDTTITQFPTPFLYDTQYYDVIDIRSVNLTGKAPDVFCKTNQINLLSTSINDIPDCMKCYYKQLVGRFIPALSPPPTPVCGPFSISPLEYASIDGQTITIRGTNLGWGLNTTDISPNLVLYQANSAYIYHFPQGVNSSLLDFSLEKGYQANVSWVLANVVYSGPIFTTQILDGKVRLDFTIKINQDFYHYIQLNTAQGDTSGKVYNFTMINGNTTSIIVDQMELKIGLNRLNITNQYSSYPKYYSYIPSFPRFDSISNDNTSMSLITNGSLVSIAGYFHTIYFNTTKILLNGEEQCIIESLASDNIKCRIPSTLIGIVQLKINVTNFITPSYYFNVNSTVVMDDLCSEFNNCSGNGVCDQFGKCNCFTGFNGESCQFESSNIDFIPNNRSTVSFQVPQQSNYQFNFEIISIHELNIRNEIVKEVLTKRWNTVTIESNTNTTLQNTLNSASTNAIVVSNIVFIKQQTDYSFGGFNRTLSPNSIKMSVSINGWPFSSQLNRIRINFKTNMEYSTRYDECGNEIVESSSVILNEWKGLNYLKVEKDGILFFGSFLDYAVADNKVVYTLNELQDYQPKKTTLQIGVILPYCQNCVLDPDFSALVMSSTDDTKDCGNSPSRLTTQQIVGIAVGAAGFVFITALLLVLFLKKKFIIVQSLKSIKLISKK